MMIVVVEVAIRWRSPAAVGRLLGCPIATSAVESTARRVRDEELPERTVRQLRCARRVANAWPFSVGPCLRQALVGGHLIRRHQPVVRLGVDPSSPTFAAHAWLEIDGRPLENIDRYLVFEEQTPRSEGHRDNPAQNRET